MFIPDHAVPITQYEKTKHKLDTLSVVHTFHQQFGLANLLIIWDDERVLERNNMHVGVLHRLAEILFSAPTVMTVAICAHGSPGL